MRAFNNGMINQLHCEVTNYKSEKNVEERQSLPTGRKLFDTKFNNGFPQLETFTKPDMRGGWFSPSSLP